MNSATATDQPPAIDLVTRLFGRISVPLDAIIHFPDGIPGFSAATRFVLLDGGAPDLEWLQSLDEPALCFLTVSPQRVVPGSWPEFPGALVIITLPTTDRPASANMRAPLLIDRVSRTGRQWIAVDSVHQTVHPFDLASLLVPDAAKGR